MAANHFWDGNFTACVAGADGSGGIRPRDEGVRRAYEALCIALLEMPQCIAPTDYARLERIRMREVRTAEGLRGESLIFLRNLARRLPEADVQRLTAALGQQ